MLAYTKEKPCKTENTFSKKLTIMDLAIKICISFDITDMASFDDCELVDKSSFVMEEGSYEKERFLTKPAW